jgi:hypothetical protein
VSFCLVVALIGGVPEAPASAAALLRHQLPRGAAAGRLSPCLTARRRGPVIALARAGGMAGEPEFGLPKFEEGAKTT